MVISARRLLSLSCFPVMFTSTATSFLARSCSRRLVASRTCSSLRLSKTATRPLSTLLGSTCRRPYLSVTAAANFHSSSVVAMTSVDDIINSFTSPLVGTDVPLAMQALLDADCVCFDVDSTVINEEGIVSSIEGWVGDCMPSRGGLCTLTFCC